MDSILNTPDTTQTNNKAACKCYLNIYRPLFIKMQIPLCRLVLHLHKQTIAKDHWYAHIGLAHIGDGLGNAGNLAFAQVTQAMKREDTIFLAHAYFNLYMLGPYPTVQS